MGAGGTNFGTFFYFGLAKRESSVQIRERFQRLYDTLRIEKSVEKMKFHLVGEWTNVGDIVIKSYQTKPDIQFPAFGISSTAGFIISISGLMLLFLFTSFFFSFEGYNRSRDKIIKGNRSVDFPIYNSKNDPLYKPAPASIYNIMSHAVWFAFLLMVPFIISIAIYYRFDFRMIVSGDIILATSQEVNFSYVIDMVNVVCLFLILSMIRSVTARHFFTNSESDWFCGLFVAMVYLIVFIIYSYDLSQYVYKGIGGSYTLGYYKNDIIVFVVTILMVSYFVLKYVFSDCRTISVIALLIFIVPGMIDLIFNTY